MLNESLSSPLGGEITFVTGNHNKLREARAILGESLVSRDIDLVEIQGTPEEVAADKCMRAFKKVGGPVLTEDVSLIFDAYGNTMPGPYIKWFYKAVGLEGLNKMLLGYEDKSASCLCVYAYMDKWMERPAIFVGIVGGKIVDPIYSDDEDNNFGFDPIFSVEVDEEGRHQTFSQMSRETKNKISHRAKALSLVKEFLNQHYALATTKNAK